MVCPGLESLTNATIATVMAFPNTCDVQFYAKILIAIFISLTFIVYFNDLRRQTKADLISAAGVSAVVVMILTVFGSLAGFIESVVLIEILIGGIIITAVWLFKDR